MVLSTVPYFVAATGLQFIRIYCIGGIKCNFWERVHSAIKDIVTGVSCHKAALLCFSSVLLEIFSRACRKNSVKLPRSIGGTVPGSCKSAPGFLLPISFLVICLRNSTAAFRENITWELETKINLFRAELCSSLPNLPCWMSGPNGFTSLSLSSGPPPRKGHDNDWIIVTFCKMIGRNSKSLTWTLLLVLPLTFLATEGNSYMQFICL